MCVAPPAPVRPPSTCRARGSGGVRSWGVQQAGELMSQIPALTVVLGPAWGSEGPGQGASGPGKTSQQRFPSAVGRLCPGSRGQALQGLGSRPAEPAGGHPDTLGTEHAQLGTATKLDSRAQTPPGPGAEGSRGAQKRGLSGGGRGRHTHVHSRQSRQPGLSWFPWLPWGPFWSLEEGGGVGSGQRRESRSGLEPRPSPIRKGLSSWGSSN